MMEEILNKLVEIGLNEKYVSDTFKKCDLAGAHKIKTTLQTYVNEENLNEIAKINEGLGNESVAVIKFISQDKNKYAQWINQLAEIQTDVWKSFFDQVIQDNKDKKGEIVKALQTLLKP